MSPPTAANGPPASPAHSTGEAAADEQQPDAERSTPPPPQRPPPRAKRLLVVASVLAYVLLLGVPVWWRTTSLHRPALPHDAMQAAAQDAAAGGEAAFLPVALQVVVVLSQEEGLSAAQLHASLAAAIARQQPGLPLQLSVVLVTTRDGAGHCSRHPPAAPAACPDLSGAPLLGAGSGAVADEQQLDEWLASNLLAGAAPGAYSLLLLPGEQQQGDGAGSSSSSSSSVRVGRHRHAWATYSAAATVQQLQDAAVSAASAVLSCCFGVHAGAAGLAAARPLPVSAGGRTHLSLSLLNAAPGPGGQAAYTWDMQRWEDSVLAPLAASLAPVTALTSESQVLHYTPARITGEWSEQHRAYVVPHAQLPYFIDSEWSLEAGRAVSAAAGGQAANCSSSSTASATAAALLIEPHVLQLVAYVPPASQRPLLLLGSDGQPLDSNSYVIPSWGGLLVLNPEPQQQQEEGQPAGPQQQLTQQQYDRITAVVTAQLQALLGVVPAADVQHLPAGAGGFSSWQVDVLMRQRAAYAGREAARVLAALSTLVQELPNLEMPDLIGQQVAQALADIALARAHTAAGAYAAAAAAASTAHAAAEAAFSHPAVLTQLNFPDSHKLGVYMPLFLPLAVPLLQGLVVQLKQRFSRDD